MEIHGHKAVFPFAYEYYSFDRAKIDLVERFSISMKIPPSELWNIYLWISKGAVCHSLKCFR